MDRISAVVCLQLRVFECVQGKSVRKGHGDAGCLLKLVA